MEVKELYQVYGRCDAAETRGMVLRCLARAFLGTSSDVLQLLASELGTYGRRIEAQL